jgi:hypothetical protein
MRSDRVILVPGGCVSPPFPASRLFASSRPEPERPRLPGFCAAVRGITIHRISARPTATTTNRTTATTISASVLPEHSFARTGMITVMSRKRAWLRQDPGVHRAACVSPDACICWRGSPDERSGPFMMIGLGGCTLSHRGAGLGSTAADRRLDLSECTSRSWT